MSSRIESVLWIEIGNRAMSALLKENARCGAVPRCDGKQLGFSCASCLSYMFLREDAIISRCMVDSSLLDLLNAKI